MRASSSSEDRPVTMAASSSIPLRAEAVHSHTQEDAGQSSSQHTQKIAEVEVWRVDMQVTREAVLDSCADEAEGPQGGHFYLNQN